MRRWRWGKTSWATSSCWLISVHVAQARPHQRQEALKIWSGYPSFRFHRPFFLIEDWFPWPPSWCSFYVFIFGTNSAEWLSIRGRKGLLCILCTYSTYIWRPLLLHGVWQVVPRSEGDKCVMWIRKTSRLVNRRPFPTTNKWGGQTFATKIRQVDGWIRRWKTFIVTRSSFIDRGFKIVGIWRQ